MLLKREKGVALTVPREHFAPLQALAGPLTLLVLPDSVESELSELASNEFVVMCRDSLDLLSRKAVLQLETKKVCLELDAWRFDLDFYDRVSGSYCLGLAAGNSFALARHRLNTSQIELLEVDLQATCGCSGPNYNPYLIWTDEQLTAAKSRHAEEALPGTQRRIECVAVELRSSEAIGNTSE
jgi:hypothetical protein